MKPKGDVAWYFPNAKRGSRPFAYSTVATSDLIVTLYEKYGDLRLVYENLHYDEDAKIIVSEYLKRGIYQVNIRQEMFMVYIKKDNIIAEVENYIDGLRYYLDKGYTIQSCYSNEEEVVVNLENYCGDEAIETFSIDEELSDDYFINNLSKLADRIRSRHSCAVALGKPISTYEKDIVRVIENIIRGEDDPINARPKSYGKSCKIIIVDDLTKIKDEDTEV